MAESTTIKKLITDFENVVLAGSGVDSFEEIFKLIFCKLYDEIFNSRRPQFRACANAAETGRLLRLIFQKARDSWPGIFSRNDDFALSPSELQTSAAFLQDAKLFNPNLEIMDDAFEYLESSVAKGNKGQYFTPRYIIEMCVRMLNPKLNEYMIDPACGSCGFPLHTAMYVWNTLKTEKSRAEYARKHIFGIDFDARSVRVARMLNNIAGGGRLNVLCLNTLDYTRWRNIPELETLSADKNHHAFNFDIVMTNPPFAGDISDNVVIDNYALAADAKGRKRTKISRDVLFIERCLDFLKPGGRMAMVLPQGRLNNAGDKRVRDFIAERCRILAVVGLHPNVFKPHTGTKTSVLFVQKWNDDAHAGPLCPHQDDYRIFFAAMREPSKNGSGEKIYEPFPDKHGSPIVKHDLYNTDGLTRDGIAEAFIEFAKKECLSFFQDALLSV
jgi:type I restriction enzyme M protein